MKARILLILIIVLAFLLRFYLLGKNPPSINTDEAAIGYNAYSILKTGRDEYGQFLPLAFRSFDDYKPPLYIYLTVPAVAVFGLTEYAVRFPGAAMGVMAVFFVYFLFNRLFHRPRLGLLCSFFVAISPWHLIYTRSAFESGALVFFTAAAVYFFFKGQDRKFYYLPSILFFGLSPFLYQSAKAFTPLLVGLLLFFFIWLKNYAVKSKIIISVIYVLILVPGLLTLISPEGSLRFQGMSIFNDQQAGIDFVETRRVDWLRNDNRSVLLFHPLFATHLDTLISSYLSYFRLDYLFMDHSDTRPGYVSQNGLLYLFELPFLIIGFYFLFRKFPLPYGLFILSWLLIAPLAGSVVVGAPTSVRSTTMIIPLNLIVAIGILFSLKSLPRHGFYKILSSLILTIIVIYGLAFYEHMLFVHAPIEHSEQWYYSYKQVVARAQQLAPSYDHVVVSNTLDQPYIFFLFYTKKNPLDYQKSGGTVSGGFRADQNKFDKYSFVFLDWNRVHQQPHTLIIGAYSDFPTDTIVSQRFSYLDGKPSVFFSANN